MEVSKIIYGRVGPRGTYTEGMITEEDYGILFQMPDLDLPAAYQVDFSNKLTGGTALTVVGNEDGALIPTSLIDSGKDVYAFLYYTGVGFGKTTHVFRIILRSLRRCPCRFRQCRISSSLLCVRRCGLHSIIEGGDGRVDD